MRTLIHALDRFLRRRLRLEEVCDDPRCVFRMRRVVTSRRLGLDGNGVPEGAPMVELHFWNEHFLPVPDGGPNVRWAVEGRKRVSYSCSALAQRLASDPDLADVRALGGTTPLFAAGDGSAWERLFRRLGFELEPHPEGRGEFWQRLYAWLIMWGFNVGARGPGRLRDVHRTDFWMSSKDFIERHGVQDAPESAAAGQV